MAFTAAILKAHNAVRDRSTMVHPSHWQSIDVSAMPEAATHEVLNYTLQCPVTTEDLDKLRLDIKPNLPWADDHFLERVGGQPLNPPPSHRYWPFSTTANDKFTKAKELELDDRDWAYLAALIDGDGSISYATKTEGEIGRPRISISQKDHAFIEALAKRYPFGRISIRERDNVKTPDGKVRRSNAAIWYIEGKAQVGFVLSKIEPYLILKRDKAKAAISHLDSLPAHHSDKPFEVPGEPIFSHTYPERFWPKHAAGAVMARRGIRYNYGDLGDVVDMLRKQPLTRQAFLPMWSFEDTGNTSVRVPCTLGYHFIMRHGFLHVTYYIRSCDIYRHMADDIYLTVRLQLWVLEQLRKLAPDTWSKVHPGLFTMHIVSLHCFRNDWQLLYGAKK